MIVKKSLIIILAFTMGCTLHRPQEITLSEPVPDKYEWAENEMLTAYKQNGWWEIFEDEQLNQVMQKAFANNLSLAQASSRIIQFEAIQKQARAAKFPSLKLDGRAARSQSLSVMGVSTGESYNLSVAAGYEIDLWGKLSSKERAREFEKRASNEDMKSLYLTLSAQIADTYYLLAASELQLGLIENTIKSRKATVELVERRYIEGMVSALDVHQAQQTLANVEGRKPEIENTIAVTSHQLSILMGGYPNPNMSQDVPVLPHIQGWFPNGLPSDLLLNRPDIQAEMLRLRSSDEEIGAAIAARFPSINLLADYGRSGSDYGLSLSSTVWNLVANITMPLIDWGGRKAEVTRREAIFNEKLFHYRETVLKAFKEVEDALVSQKKTEEMLIYLEKEVQSANASLELVLDQYKGGLSNYLPVLTTEILTTDAQTRLIMAQRELISHRISLARACGGTWMASYIDEKKNQEGVD